MRVLHVCQPTVAGVPVVVAQLARDQREAGLDVAVASPADGDLPAWLAAAGVAHLPWSAGRNPGPSVPGETRALDRLVRAVGPDLVHLHSAKAGLAGRLALRGRLPTVFQPHAWSYEAATGVQRWAATRWERAATRWTDLLVCVSAQERAEGERVGVRAETLVLPNGVDVDRLRPAGAGARDEARARLGLADRPTVVCIGRLARQKGQDVLVDALPALRAAVPGTQVVLVGEGPDEQQLRAAAPEGVVFAGKQGDVVPWLVAADVVALPSRWEAGLSLVAMEAMALERCVVSADVAGAADGLRGAGAVVPVDDPAALAAALAPRLTDPALAEREGRAGRDRVVAEHDQAQTAPRVRDAYARVLGSRAAPAR